MITPFLFPHKKEGVFDYLHFWDRQTDRHRKQELLASKGTLEFTNLSVLYANTLIILILFSLFTERSS